MKPKHIIGFLAAIGLTFGQTLVDLKTQTKNVDFSRALSVRPFPTGTGLPSACNTGEMFFRTDTTSGANLYGCVAPNTWALESVDLEGPGPAGITVVTTGNGDPAASCSAPSASNLSKYYDATAKKMWTCVGANKWELDLTVDPTATLLIDGNAGAAPASPGSGKVYVYSDSMLKGLSAKDDAGQITRTVRPTDCSSTGMVQKINADGTVTCAAQSGGGGKSFADFQPTTPAIVLPLSVETTLFTTTIPGGTLTPGHCLVGSVSFQHTLGAHNVGFYLWFGSVQTRLRSITDNGTYQATFEVCDYTDPSHQQFNIPTITWSATSGAVDVGSPVSFGLWKQLTEDVTANTVLKLTSYQDIDGGDTVVGLSWRVALQ